MTLGSLVRAEAEAERALRNHVDDLMRDPAARAAARSELRALAAKTLELEAAEIEAAERTAPHPGTGARPRRARAGVGGLTPFYLVRLMMDSAVFARVACAASRHDEDAPERAGEADETAETAQTAETAPRASSARATFESTLREAIALYFEERQHGR